MVYLLYKILMEKCKVNKSPTDMRKSSYSNRQQGSKMQLYKVATMVRVIQTGAGALWSHFLKLQPTTFSY